MMEQIDSMGVPAHFSNCLYLCTMYLLLIQHLGMKHEIPASSESRFIHTVNKASSEQGWGWGFHAYKWTIGPFLVGRAKLQSEERKRRCE